MKVSYNKRSSPGGTAYDQCISMQKYNFKQLLKAIEQEMDKGFPQMEKYCPEGYHYAKIFLSMEIPVRDSVAYLNLTQRNFVELYLPIEIVHKLKDRNTCILIKE